MLSTSLRAAAFAAVCALFPSQVAADAPYHTNLKAFQDGDMGRIPKQSFHTSDLEAPIYQINRWDADQIDTEGEYIFLAGKYPKWGPSIISAEDLSLIWADQRFNGLAQTARTWENWRGHDRVMTIYVDGRVRVYSQSYEELYVLSPKGSLSNAGPDSHEAMLTHDGHVLMIACPHKEVDLRPVGGPEKGKGVGNCHIQEMDPDTNEVFFQWATLDFFNVEDSVRSYHNEDNWDFCHMNAVEKTPEGNYIVSYRHLATVIMIDGKTKEVKWAMWGKRNMFKDISPPGTTATFKYQHEARITGNNTFTLFDNHHTDNGFCEEGQCSRGMEVEYDDEAMTVKIINEWKHPQNLRSGSRGGVQRTSSGNVLVAWGQNPMLTEYNDKGEVVMDVQRGQILTIMHGVYDCLQYRAWKGKWDGFPSWGPEIAYKSGTVYVSWNGATRVKSWVLLTSDDELDLASTDAVVAVSPRNGFETPFKVSSIKKFARVAALDKDGSIIGSTKAVNTKTGKKVELDYEIENVYPGDEVVALSVPTSAAVTMPTSVHISPSESSVDVGKIIGIAVAAFLCLVALLGAVVFIWRRVRARRGMAKDSKADVSYGLLMNDDIDGNENTSQEDLRPYPESRFRDKVDEPYKHS